VVAPIPEILLLHTSGSRRPQALRSKRCVKIAFGAEAGARDNVSGRGVFSPPCGLCRPGLHLDGPQGLRHFHVGPRKAQQGALGVRPPSPPHGCHARSAGTPDRAHPQTRQRPASEAHALGWMKTGKKKGTPDLPSTSTLTPALTAVSGPGVSACETAIGAPPLKHQRECL